MVRSPYLTACTTTEPLLTSYTSFLLSIYVFPPAGTTDFTDEPCANFEGDEDLNPPSNALRKVKAQTMELSFVGGDSEATKEAAATAGMADSRDINVVRLFHKYMRTADRRDADELMKEISSRVKADDIFKALVDKLYPVEEVEKKSKMFETHMYKPTKYDCHREIIKMYNEKCPEQFTDYSLKHTKVVVNLCEDLNGDVSKISNALSQVC